MMDYLGGAIVLLCQQRNSDVDAPLVAQLQPTPVDVLSQVRSSCCDTGKVAAGVVMSEASFPPHT